MSDEATLSPNAVLEEVAALLQELHPHAEPLPPLRLDARLDRDLGLDSLSRMELLARLERRFHAVIPQHLAMEVQTLADLLQAFRAALPPPFAKELNVMPEPLDQQGGGTPDNAATLIDVLMWHAERHPTRMHVHFAEGDIDGIELSYGALYNAAKEVASGLQQDGLRVGETAALMFPTHPDLLSAFFGVLLAGGVPVPLYPPSRPSEFGEYWRRQTGILRNCGARYMLVGDAIFAHRHAIGALAGTLERVLTVASLRKAGTAFELVLLHSKDLAMLQYTSGSTADPKGVMLSHANLLANIRIMGRRIGASAKDIFVSWLPLYHDMGLIGAWLGSLYFGIPLVLIPPQAFLLHPECWLRSIQRFRATLSAAPNFAYELCLHRIDEETRQQLDLHSLRLCFCGAEPVFPDTMERFIARFSASGLSSQCVLPVYGLAENTLGLSFPPVGRLMRVLRIQRDRFLHDGVVTLTDKPQEAALRFVSCGPPLPEHAVRIVDSFDHEQGEGRQGSIQFQGPSATAGYFHHPDLSRQLRHGDWLDTGDLGFVWEGELYLTGRSKDVIIRAGQHIHPQNIEQTVGDIAGIRRGRIAAFGTESQGTQRLIVVAETRITDTLGRDALRTAVNQAVQDCTGQPADDVVLAAPGTLLKTSSGKLRRAACRAAYEGGHLDTPDRLRLLRVMARSSWDRLRRHACHARMLAYAAYAWTMTGLAALPAFLCVALPLRAATRWTLLRQLLRILAAATGIGLRVDMRDFLPERPCILVANHASYIDALVTVWALPRPVAFVAKQELAGHALLRWALKRLGTLFVARSDPHTCTQVVLQAEASKHDVLFFPEGTFRGTPGLLPFHLGAFMAAAQSGMPVVPMAIQGTRTILRGEEWLPRAGHAQVTIHAAIIPDKDNDRWHEALRLSAEARSRILQNNGEPDASHVRIDIDSIAS